MSTINIYYFTFFSCLYWQLFTISASIKLNGYNSLWFFVYLLIHFVMLIYWYFNSWTWSGEHEGDKGYYDFNPLLNRITYFNIKTLREEILINTVRNKLIDANIGLSVNLTIMFNIIYIIFYSIFNVIIK